VFKRSALLRLGVHEHADRRHELRQLRHDVRSGAERDRELRGGAMRVRVCARISRLLRSMRFELLYGIVRDFVHALPRTTSQRDRHVRWNELRVHVQQRVSPLRWRVRCE
jgi:hypothetical protein